MARGQAGAAGDTARPATDTPKGADAAKAETGKAAKKPSKAEKPDKPKAKTGKSKSKSAKPKDDAKGDPAAARPATNANGGTQPEGKATAPDTQQATQPPGSEPGDVLSGLVR
jgi:hypothetical protein